MAFYLLYGLSGKSRPSDIFYYQTNMDDKAINNVRCASGIPGGVLSDFLSFLIMGNIGPGQRAVVRHLRLLKNGRNSG